MKVMMRDLTSSMPRHQMITSKTEVREGYIIYGSGGSGQGLLVNPVWTDFMYVTH